MKYRFRYRYLDERGRGIEVGVFLVFGSLYLGKVKLFLEIRKDFTFVNIIVSKYMSNC